MRNRSFLYKFSLLFIFVFLFFNAYSQYPTIYSTGWEQRSCFAKFNPSNSTHKIISFFNKEYSWYEGEGTMDQIGQRYFLSTDIGIIIIDAKTGTVIDSIPTSIVAMEYNHKSNSIQGLYGDSYVSVNLITKKVKKMHLYQNFAWDMGETTFDSVGQRHFINTPNQICIIDADSGKMIDSISVDVRSIEYDYTTKKLYGILSQNVQGFFVSIDIAKKTMTKIDSFNYWSIASGESTFNSDSGIYYIVIANSPYSYSIASYNINGGHKLSSIYKYISGIEYFNSHCNTDIIPNFKYQKDSNGVKFTNTTKPYYTSSHWSFDDNQTSDSTNPVHKFNKSGIYNVCLKVFDSCGTPYSYCSTYIDTQIIYSNVNITACDSFYFKKKYIKQSGIYNDRIILLPIDSIVKLNLTIINSSRTSVDTAACYSYNFNGKVLIQSGIYHDTLKNSVGCDSIISLNLIIQNTSNTISRTVCKNYFLKGKIITESGIYYDTLINIVGCDSVVVINLTIDTVNTSVSKTGATLSANASSANYQWIDCNNNLLINGANNQSFTSTTNGNYAVIISQNSCTDTSYCLSITENCFSNNIKIFPNPTDGIFTIQTSDSLTHAYIKLIDILGQNLYEVNHFYGYKFTLDISNLPAAVYIFEIKQDDCIARIKLIKN